MCTLVNDIKIYIDLNSGIRVNVVGPDNCYYVEVREYPKNEDNSLYLEGYHIFKNPPSSFRDTFILPIEFFVDFEISIYRFVDKEGLVKVFSHRYNDLNQSVLFKLSTKSIDEANLWVEKINKYKKYHGCEVTIESDFDDINKKSDTFYQTTNITPYKTYRIGRFPKNSNDYRTYDKRKEGLIWFGNWKTFWSYQHPRPWKLLSSENIIEDILGL